MKHFHVFPCQDKPEARKGRYEPDGFPWVFGCPWMTQHVLKTWILIKDFPAVHSYIFVPYRSFDVFNKIHLWLFPFLYWRTTLFTFFVSFYFTTTVGYMFHILICLSNLVKIGHRDYVVSCEGSQEQLTTKHFLCGIWIEISKNI